MTVTEADWSEARRVVRRAVGTSLHCSIASISSDGSPHVTPIGSVLLNELGSGLYFDVFNRRLARNVARDPRIAILAVDSSRLTWLRSLIKGRFIAPPGVRLIGQAGSPRESTPEEVRRFRRIVGPLLRTPGGQALWGSLAHVRDFAIEKVEALSMGAMNDAGRFARHA